MRKPAREPTVKRAVRRSTAAKQPKALKQSAPFLPATSVMISPITTAQAVMGAQAPEHPATVGAHAQEMPASAFSIPSGYGDNRIVLVVKDPWWLHAYWEIQPSVERAARGQLLPHEAAGLQSILRVYDVTDVDFPTQPAHGFFDIPLSGLATNWYIQTNAPNHSFVVDVGLLTNTGRFLLLARSNRVTAPRFGPSEVIDEQWMTTDEAYWKLLGAGAGIGVGSSQSGSGHLLAQHYFSGGWSSGSFYGLAKPATVRGFWCRVSADIVVYGATDPKATVAIQGQPVAVKKDGTFSARLTLSNGTQAITIDVTAADGRQSKTISPVATFHWSGLIGSSDPGRSSAKLTQHPEQRT